MVTLPTFLDRSSVLPVKVLQWLAWIAVIALAAALPWLVNDWVHQQEMPPATTEEIDPSGSLSSPTPDAEVRSIEPLPAPPMSDAPALRNTGEKVGDFFRQLWLDVAGPADDT
ncbi:MAG: hypothetical protein KDM64_15965, partial [Verrucomicrobiae bacterium]|nr:hypothetical protein [Verrucomicrobiae bacterium]